MKDITAFKNVTAGLYKDATCSELICDWDSLQRRKVIRVINDVLCGTTTIDQVDSLAGVLVIPECVKKICDNAFTRESNLVGVLTLGKLQSIGKAAFMGCSNLQTIQVNCEDIGESAFMRCMNLKEVCNQADHSVVGQNAFCWCLSLRDVVLPKDTKVYDKAFFGCDKDIKIEYV